VDGVIRRVLVTVDEATWGPVWPLVRGVGGLGVHVVLCTLGPPLSRSRRAAAKALPHVTLHESTWPVESSPEPWADLIRAGAWPRELAGRYDVDLVPLDHMALGPLPWGRGRTSVKSPSSPRPGSSTLNTPRPPRELTMRAEIDFAASNAAGESCWGCKDSRTLPPGWW